MATEDHRRHGKHSYCCCIQKLHHPAARAFGMLRRPDRVGYHQDATSVRRFCCPAPEEADLARHTLDLLIIARGSQNTLQFDLLAIWHQERLGQLRENVTHFEEQQVRRSGTSICTPIVCSTDGVSSRATAGSVAAVLMSRRGCTAAPLPSWHCTSYITTEAPSPGFSICPKTGCYNRHMPSQAQEASQYYNTVATLNNTPFLLTARQQDKHSSWAQNFVEQKPLPHTYRSLSQELRAAHCLSWKYTGSLQGGCGSGNNGGTFQCMHVAPTRSDFCCKVCCAGPPSSRLECSRLSL